MTGPYYLTFDIGTTSLKTALIDGGGRCAAVHTEEYSFQSPRPGWAELSPDTYWRAAVVGTRSVLGKLDNATPEISAIGFSSQGQTFVSVDDSGRPLSDAIVWIDNRAQAIAQDWEARWLSCDEFRLITGYPRLPAELTVFKIAWLAGHSPRAHGAWKFLCLPDYLIHHLTGEVATDYTIALHTGLYSLRTQDWEPRLLSAAGITPEQLPRVHRPGSVVGRVRPDVAAELGIAAGVPVCTGANDQIAGAIGAGNARAGIVSETTGTALAVISTTEGLLDDSRLVVGQHAADAFYAMPYANTSAIVLKWLRDLCSPGEGYGSFLAGVEAVPIGCDGLTVLPHFCGTASPTFNPDARGVFTGLTMSHTRLHLARAVMESCACLLRECLSILTDNGTHVERVRSLGGAARSDAWLQMKADMLGLPVERPACSDAASLGAAMLAATGVGRFATVEEASKAWYRPSRVFESNPPRSAAYQDVYDRYRTLYDRLYGQERLGL